ncbi:MAG TPA: hypothetical protein VEW48_05195 [Thermoanaerobaculia bacterium]|nr:hypothetical protein [Thermoanaerobaculia bacterium]
MRKLRKRVEIHVDQLVLHGLPAGQRRAVGEAVERELARIGAQGEIAAGRQLQIPEIRLPREGKPS